MVYLFGGLAILWILISLFLFFTSRTIKNLSQLSISNVGCLPSVTIIIPVRNEGMTLEQALQTVIDLEYPFKEIVLINDRSTDNTGEIIAQFKARYSAITVINIDELPSGWLGKNNALYQGSLHSKTEWLLFTDADIHFQKKSLNKAITYCTENGLDHLSVFPDPSSSSVMLNSILETFKIMFDIKMQPWRVKDEKSKYAIGIGAFNLVKKSLYEQCGGHKSISLRPDDDLKLGALLKGSGGKADVLYGKGELKVEWYSSVMEFINGLMKNTFSTFDYKFYLVIPSVLMTLVVFVLPYVSLFYFNNPVIWCSGLIVLVSQALLILFGKGYSGKWWHVLMIPFAGMIMSYILTASALKVLFRGGIVWRATFYPLKELRNQV